MNKAIVLAIVILICIAIGALKFETPPADAGTPINYQARFTTYASNNASYPTHAHVIVDNVTGVEYMMIEAATSNFGKSVAVCPLYEADGRIKVR